MLKIARGRTSSRRDQRPAARLFCLRSRPQLWDENDVNKSTPNPVKNMLETPVSGVLEVLAQTGHKNSWLNE